MSTPPPPAPPFAPPPMPASDASPPPTARPHLLSRRALLLGAGGAVITTGGVAAWISSGSSSGRGAAPSTTTTDVSSTSTSPATTPSSSPPMTTPPTTTATTVPASTVPAVAASDRVLVVVQMSGGNDALNTLVPVTGAYHDARPSIGLADDSLIALAGGTGYGLHPALAPLAPILDAGQLGIVAGIGFDQPDRSHFAALDMWWSAAPGDTFRSGWLGRWLDATADSGSTGSSPSDVLRAIGLGGAVPALRAEVTRAIGVNEIERFVLPTGESALIEAWASLAGSHASARAATDVFAGLATNASTDSGDGETVIDRLVAAAELIITEPGVRVVHVTMGSFDTHSAQLDTHQRLLGELAAGIAAFRQRLSDAGHWHRALLVTTSEFGRRVAENGSVGTDHGKAGVQFVVGDAVATAADGAGGVVFGSLDPGDLLDGDLRPVVDPRSLYATALDWVGADAAGAIADGVLGATYERLPFLRG